MKICHRATGAASAGFADGRILAAAATLALSLAAFWPTLRAYYFLDDFAFVAIARYTDHPLAYYLSQHFPGGLFYRPSGMLLWWLTVAGDLGPATQFAVNWLLLGCASLLLAHLLRTLGLRSSVAIGAPLVFAVHPIAVTTAGWLSNRFDLLAAIGLLVALAGAARWQRQPATAALVLTTVGTLLAVTAKELGFITPIAVWALSRERAWARLVSPPVLASATTAATVFVVRRLLLPGTDRILYPDGVLDAGRQGTLVWMKFLPDILVFVPDHPFAARALFALAVVAVIAAATSAVRRFRAEQSGTVTADVPERRAIALGIAVFVSAALVQSPTVARSTLELPTARAFDGEAFFAARFYYLALIGLLIACAGLASALSAAQRTAATSSGIAPGDLRTRFRSVGLGGVVLAMLLAYWGWQSRVQGRLWAAEASGTNRAIATEAAVAVMNALVRGPAPAQGCRFYLVDTMDAAPTFWPFADTVVKAVVSRPDARRLASCIIATENTPWYHVLRADAAHMQPELPFQPICLFGKVFPSLIFDSVAMHYLAYPRNGGTLALSASDRVLRYDRPSRRFEDVTPRVASGELAIRLRWSRPDENSCPAGRPQGAAERPAAVGRPG